MFSLKNPKYSKRVEVRYKEEEDVEGLRGRSKEEADRNKKERKEGKLGSNGRRKVEYRKSNKEYSKSMYSNIIIITYYISNGVEVLQNGEEVR